MCQSNDHPRSIFATAIGPSIETAATAQSIEVSFSLHFSVPLLLLFFPLHFCRCLLVYLLSAVAIHNSIDCTAAAAAVAYTCTDFQLGIFVLKLVLLFFLQITFQCAIFLPKM